MFVGLRRACVGMGVLLGACVDRQVGDDETGSSAGETSPSEASGVTPTETNPSSPGTSVTSGPATTETTQSTVATLTTPTTDGPDSSTDPSGTDTEMTWKLDLPSQPVEIPEAIMKGCTKQGPLGAGIKGESAFGPFFGQRAYFGYVLINGELGNVRLMFLDDATDAELAFTELAEGFGEVATGPAVHVEPSQVFTQRDPFWSGTDTTTELVVRKDGKFALVMATVFIAGPAGNWDVPTPDDPPRLVGVIEPGGDEFAFAGGFDAVFCDLLVQQIIAE